MACKSNRNWSYKWSPPPAERGADVKTGIARPTRRFPSRRRERQPPPFRERKSRDSLPRRDWPQPDPAPVEEEAPAPPRVSKVTASQSRKNRAASSQAGSIITAWAQPGRITGRRP